MARLLSFLLFAVLTVVVAACGDDDASFATASSGLDRVEDPQVPAADAAELEAGNTAFAFDLYRELGAEPGNLFFSPHSISTALAMTYAGARTATEQEMAATLHFTLPQDRLHPAFNALDQALAERSKVKLAKDEKGSPPELHIANATWGDKEYRFLDDYLDVLALNYGAGLRLLDFRKDPEGSRETINSWVEEQTNDRIKDLIPEGAIDGLTRLVLTNAIYFKASWVTAFDEGKTAPAPFQLLDGSSVEASMMRASGAKVRYARAGSFQAVELPYIGNEVSMLILLPDAGKFAEAEAGLDADELRTITAALKPVLATLSMPKFEFEWELSLKDPLRALGMESAFEGADFSGMDGTRNLAITDVLHKSFIAVDEQGTEAAAATAVIIGETAAPEVVEVTVDRPFIFLIRDKPTGAILFLGRLASPK